MSEASLGYLQTEDSAFSVEEIPAYLPSGAGEHLYLRVRKRGLTTDAVAARLGRACGLGPVAVGFAGRKDRHAVTVQWFSVRGVSLAGTLPLVRELERADGQRCQVLEISRHVNKLRLGHLRGNRFVLRLGGLESEPLRSALRERLAELRRAGLCNRFGPQRFGTRGSTLEIARAWARGDLGAALGALIDPGTPAPERWRPGRALPGGRPPGPARRALEALRRRPDDLERALRAAGRGFRQLVASSAQSAIFNVVLEARERELGLYALRVGDLAQGPGGAPFRCREERLAELLESAAPGRLEVAATGPLPGRSRFEPDPPIAAQEREWAAAVGFERALFESRGVFESPGTRRPLVVPLLDAPTLEGEGPGVELRLSLPSGAYASEALRQLGIDGRGAPSGD